MPDNFPRRVNLPLTVEMHEAIKKQASSEGLTDVGYIRKCVLQDMSKAPKVKDLERRIEALEHKSTLEDSRGHPTHKSRG